MACYSAILPIPPNWSRIHYSNCPCPHTFTLDFQFGINVNLTAAFEKWSKGLSHFFRHKYPKSLSHHLQLVLSLDYRNHCNRPGWSKPLLSPCSMSPCQRIFIGVNWVLNFFDTLVDYVLQFLECCWIKDFCFD
jgi:hypothetical protein